MFQRGGEPAHQPDQIGHVLPSLLLPLWDSEMGKGFIATLRSLLAGSDVAMTVASMFSMNRAAATIRGIILSLRIDR